MQVKGIRKSNKNVKVCRSYAILYCVCQKSQKSDGILGTDLSGIFTQEVERDITSTAKSILCKKLCVTCMLHFWSAKEEISAMEWQEFDYGKVME